MIMMESMIHGSDFVQFIDSRGKYGFVQVSYRTTQRNTSAAIARKQSHPLVRSKTAPICKATSP